MMIVVVLAICVLASLWTGYTLAIQRTTAALGQLLVGTTTGTGVQDAITPASQTRRNLIMFLLIVITFAITTFAYQWYWGILAAAISVVVGAFLSRVFGLPGSRLLVGAVIRDMVKRYDSYAAKGDDLRANAMKDLIERTKDLTLNEIQSAARK